MLHIWIRPLVNLTLLTALILGGGLQAAAFEIAAPERELSALTIVFGAPEEFTSLPGEIPLDGQEAPRVTVPNTIALLQQPAAFELVLDEGSLCDGVQAENDSALSPASSLPNIGASDRPSTAAVPEPSTLLLLALGLLGLLGLVRFRRKSN